ncbi:MAG: polysaccharide deacetylase family protein [Bacteriovorax sp.]|jgi:peptidoglycan/xylan/chitin deacetylase (PgdA/CDA1 family)|nr:polysaccharide deacetylase family protein [Bacteriovorax sp.]
MLKSLTILFILIANQAYAIDITEKDFSDYSLVNIHQGTNEVILTFDDGPTPGVTDKILDILKTYDLKATFFVVGANAARYPDLMNRIMNEGHILGNHSMNHINLNKVGFFFKERKVKAEIMNAHKVLSPYTVNNKHFYFRAPEGAWGGEDYAHFLNETEIGRAYIGPVFWDIGGEIELVDGQYLQAADWACWSKKPIALTIDECMSGYINEIETKKGGVVLMHDIRPQSAEMLEKLIPQLQTRGFKFSTLNDIDWSTKEQN